MSLLTEACSSSPNKDCWLCEVWPRWNLFLRPFCLELEEEEPGNLCLQTIRPCDREIEAFDVNGVSYRTIDVLTRLTRQHRCIKGLSLGHPVFGPYCTPPPVQIRASVSAIERIDIYGYATDFWHLLLHAVGGVVALKSLRIEGAVFDSSLIWSLGELFAANGGCLRQLIISAREWELDIPSRLICAIGQCKALTELSLDGHLTLEAAAALESLLRSSKCIQKLSLRERSLDQTCLRALCGALSSGFSPSELQYECENLNFGELPELLRFNRALKHLVLSGDKWRPRTLGKHNGMALYTLLAHNTGLRSLVVRHCNWTLDAAEKVATGISLNGSLERFDLSRCYMTFDTVLTLCGGLRTNDTLKRLVCHSDHEFLHVPVDLSEKPVAAQWFARVVTTWPNEYVPDLIKTLEVPALCPTELHIGCSRSYDSSFAELCVALGSSTVKHLSVMFCNMDFRPAIQMREALIANSSIKTLALQEDHMSADTCFFVAGALVENRTVTEISINIDELDEENVIHFLDIADYSDALEKVSLYCITTVPCVTTVPCIEDYLHRTSLWREPNSTLIGFYIFNVEKHIEYVVTEVKDIVDKNRRKWNCALKFVLDPCMNKSCAEAFESLQKKPCFLQRIAAVAGKSLEDVSRMVRSAKLFIVRNYFLLTGVVSRGVTCHPHQRTQVDSLNDDCWQAIGQYLNLSDVLVPVKLPEFGLKFANSGSYYDPR